MANASRQRSRRALGERPAYSSTWTPSIGAANLATSTGPPWRSSSFRRMAAFVSRLPLRPPLLPLTPPLLLPPPPASARPTPRPLPVHEKSAWAVGEGPVAPGAALPEEHLGLWRRGEAAPRASALSGCGAAGR